MKKQTLAISTIHLSSPLDDIQLRLEILPLGETIEKGGKVYTKVAQDACEVEYSSDYNAYKFDDKKSVGSYVIKKEITANDIEAVIVNCMEGGSNYWLGLNNTTDIWKKKPQGIPLSTWTAQMLLEGETIHFYDVEDEEETWTLNLEQLIKGFALNAEKRPFDCDLNDGDATTSDCILQYGMFGKLVYG